MGWFDKDESQVKEIEHVRGSKIRSDRPVKPKRNPRWYDPTDPATHDLPVRPENWTGDEGQTLSRELFLEDLELDAEVPTKHMIVGGGTGSGKTQAIHRVLDRVFWGASNGEKAIVTDSGGQFFSTRSRKTDLLLNPFDGRSVSWNPFSEIENQWDYESLAETLVPGKSGPGAMADDWIRYARGLISSIMKGLAEEGNPDPRRVPELLRGDMEKLAPYLAGTPEEALLNPASDRFLGSVVGVASLALRPWQYLSPDGDFSIRKWIRDGAGGTLFITYKDAQMSLMKDLIGAWLGIAITEVLDLSPDFERRVWLVEDELDSLGTVAGLANANTRGRKYGLCSIGAIQSIAQLDEKYGQLGGQTLLSTFSSKIIFREGSWKDSEYWSNELGQREITEQSISKASTSGMNASSTETVSQARKVVQTVLPSELAELPDRTAYCRFPGMEGIHKIEFEIRKYKPIRPAFLSPGEPEPSFEDPKLEIVGKPVQEEPSRIPILPVAGLVALILLGWFIVSQLNGHHYHSGSPPPPAIVPGPPKAISRIFHWKNGTFRCPVTGDFIEKESCVRIGPGPAVRRKPLSPVSSPPVAKGNPVMSLPVWTGPWPPWWHCLPKNAGKWVAVNRPIRDRYGNWYSGIAGQKRERMRVRCPITRNFGGQEGGR